ncbi:GlxA family transcriptional regulator [Sneathiella chinensis]|uniref:AraC family transcriptional regulator n=1 Tax=Sneathiella chinensis TaxID=349750 RepID=A0ABQ5U442_9PROT|nr:GlxA family transcriptional regulator [Sneathiella chinensis]GLQ06608.1 AraC family transcriptional regulator [Sneathiella chinensis]
MNSSGTTLSFDKMEGATAQYSIGFCLVPDFSSLAFISAIEPLRLANRTAGRQIYDWKCYSEDGAPARSSAGLEIPVAGSFSDMPKHSIVFLCGGLDIQARCTPEVMTALRKAASYGADIGAICTGSYVLARAGMLDGHRCTIHWENTSGFREDFPDLEITTELFEIDGNRYTCAGGTASLDMMLSLISSQIDHEAALAVADQLIHHRIRDGSERQRMELRARLGISHPKLLAAISCMEDNLEDPLSCSDLATEVGLSTRQLERLFQKYLKRSPTRYYLKLRLDRARYLLTQTSLPIIEVALACGFVSASHFSKCHREHFGHTPSEERRVRT